MEDNDSLADLGAAFAQWRENKRYPREAVPAELLKRAQRAASVHGDKAVIRVTKLDRSRIWKRRRHQATRPPPTPSPAPDATFSRLELSPPSPSGPLVEIETADGLKLRVFTGAPEVLRLLSSMLTKSGRP